MDHRPSGFWAPWIELEKGSNRDSITGQKLKTIIGGIAGGGEGAAIGAFSGAAARAAGATVTGKKDVTFPSEHVLHFTLENPNAVTRQPNRSENLVKRPAKYLELAALLVYKEIRRVSNEPIP
jgi:hypothetical protein